MQVVILVDRLRRHIPKLKTILNKNVSTLEIFVTWLQLHYVILVQHDDLSAGVSPETAPAPAVSALQGISSLQGFYPMQLPQLTPGLSQYVKDDLTEHVRGWPAEACERQVNDKRKLIMYCS